MGLHISKVVLVLDKVRVSHLKSIQTRVAPYPFYIAISSVNLNTVRIRMVSLCFYVL